jgi:magnesium-transporting ATPase (P-type)
MNNNNNLDTNDSNKNTCISSIAHNKYNDEYAIESPSTIGSYFNTRFMNRIFFSIKNTSYEVYIMYAVLFITLIILIMITMDSTEDYYETQRHIRYVESQRR